ncbi:MAG: phosphoenolpyruvate synthase [Candidatus Gottesmanbacteria bacterium]
MAKKFVVWFRDVGKEDISLVGGKGANLGEMTRSGFPVPNGFIVTAEAYYYFLDENNLRDKIVSALDGLDVGNSKDLEEASKKVRYIIEHAPIPKEIATKIFQAYFHLEKGMFKHPLVAVRSSATAEDLPNASFAGQQETFLNVKGEANLLEKIRSCWASLFTQRAIFYRQTNHFDHFLVGIAVPVQKMVASDMSGIMFTIDPVTNNKEHIVIEAIYGLGEMIVQGMVTPDHYEVDKKSNDIIKKIAKTQEKMMYRKNGKNVVQALSKKTGEKNKLTDKQILALADLGKRLEAHYYFPQDSEWAIEKNKIYIVQTRPVTTIGMKSENAVSSTVRAQDIIAEGDPASPGISSGPVKILQSAKEIGKIQHGDILVAEQTNPDYVPAMKKASAIVTERGGRTSHAAIVSRELGIPAVVGTEGIMTKVKNDMIITVNGSTGVISKGAVTASSLKTPIAQMKHIKTATKVYVNLAEPERAAAIARMDVDGVGLLRAEFMIAGIGTHPKKLIADHKERIFIDTLSDQLATFCKAFSPRPVIYRATDFKTNEYRSLKGGNEYEPEESNPMLGFRGAARYIADKQVFEMELEAIKQVRNKHRLKNLWFMIPFVRSPEELLRVKQIMASAGLTRSSNFKLFLMVEIPTNVIRLDEFLDVGMDGVSIGSNDLTMLIMGTDRDNSEVAKQFNEQDPSVLWAIEKTIKTCIKRNVTVSICGQAPSDYPNLVEKLVSWGITSVSINPDAVDHVRETIAHAERRLVAKGK